MDLPFKLLRPAEVAKLLGLSEAHVTKLAREGKLPMKKIGKRWRIRDTELDEWWGKQATGKQG